MKYRTVVRDSLEYPFVIERQMNDGSGWHQVTVAKDKDDVEKCIRKDIESIKAYKALELPPAGTVFNVYEENDLIALILKG
jgi:hypothetical protein